jgi:3-methyladenine DNA glycosylase AlkD
MQTGLISAIQKELEAHSDKETRESARNFFKERALFHGVKTATVGKIAQQRFAEVKHLSKQEIFILCEELFKTDFGEEAFIACDWAYRLRRQYEPADFTIFERWVSRYVNNWAKCDTLCNHSIGAFIDLYPQYVEKLKKWAKAENRWLRRAAAVTLILPARQGKFLRDIFEMADILLADSDDLVQKGYGWMLKEASRQHQQEVFNYVVRHKTVMPRTALRYAIEKMPPELRRLAMSK